MIWLLRIIFNADICKRKKTSSKTYVQLKAFVSTVLWRKFTCVTELCNQIIFERLTSEKRDSTVKSGNVALLQADFEAQKQPSHIKIAIRITLFMEIVIWHLRDANASLLTSPKFVSTTSSSQGKRSQPAISGPEVRTDDRREPGAAGLPFVALATAPETRLSRPWRHFCQSASVNLDFFISWILSDSVFLP